MERGTRPLLARHLPAAARLLAGDPLPAVRPPGDIDRLRVAPASGAGLGARARRSRTRRAPRARSAACPSRARRSARPRRPAGRSLARPAPTGPPRTPPSAAPVGMAGAGGAVVACGPGAPDRRGRNCGDLRRGGGGRERSRGDRGGVVAESESAAAGERRRRERRNHHQPRPHRTPVAVDILHVLIAAVAANAMGDATRRLQTQGRRSAALRPPSGLSSSCSDPP